jgi:hypothetical protein
LLFCIKIDSSSNSDEHEIILYMKSIIHFPMRKYDKKSKSHKHKCIKNTVVETNENLLSTKIHCGIRRKREMNSVAWFMQNHMLVS